MPGLRSPPFVCWAAAPPRRKQGRKLRGNAGVGSALAFAYLWDGSGFRTRTGGEKPAHRESGNAGNGSRGLFPVLSLLGRLVETRCSCRRGGSPALFHRETRRLCGRRARGPAARPASLRKGRISTRPGRPLSSSGFVASIPKAAAISFDASNQLWMRSRDGVVHHTRADAEADNEHFNGLAHHRPPRLFRTAVDEWKDARTRVTGRYPDHRALP